MSLAALSDFLRSEREHIAAYLETIRYQIEGENPQDLDRDVEPDDAPSTPVRLRVSPDLSSWSVLFGSPDYDQDHRGYWGSSYVSGDDTAQDLRSNAVDLINQALDHYAEQEG